MALMVSLARVLTSPINLMLKTMVAMDILICLISASMINLRHNTTLLEVSLVNIEHDENHLGVCSTDPRHQPRSPHCRDRIAFLLTTNLKAVLIGYLDERYAYPSLTFYLISDPNLHLNSHQIYTYDNYDVSWSTVCYIAKLFCVCF